MDTNNHEGKKNAPEVRTQQAVSADDDLGLDKLIGAVKSFFQKKMQRTSVEHVQHASNHHSASNETPVTDDITGVTPAQVGQFVMKHALWFFLIAALLLQIIPSYGFWPCTGDTVCPWGGIWMRMQASNMPLADGWAQDTAYNQIRGRLRDSIHTQYPNLPDSRVEQVVQTKFAEELAKGGAKQQLQSQIDGISSQIRAFYQYEYQGKQYVYMPDIDPYFYLRYARNIQEKGHPWDTLRQGVRTDDHMLSPIGNTYDASIHPYLLAYTASLLKPFGYDLMQAGAVFPVLLIFLSLIPAFFIGRRLTSNVGGLATVAAIALNGAIMGRTNWGHPDTDLYNIFFPLLAMWFLFEAAHSQKTWSRVLWSGLTGLALGLYSAAWTGWWYLFDFLLAGLGLFFVVQIITEIFVNPKNLENIKSWSSFKEFLLRTPAGKTVILTILVILATGVFVTAFQSASTFLNAPLQPLEFMKIKDAARSSLWPNVLTTVAELNEPDKSQIIASVAGSGATGWFLGILAVISLVLLALMHTRDKQHLLYSFVLIIWFAGTFYASTKGVRFTLLAGPAFGVALGGFFGLTYEYLSGLWNRGNIEATIRIAGKVTTALVLLGIFSLLLLPVSRQSFAMARNDVPIVNDAWYNVLTQINAGAKPDAVVNSWWDFGHHFKWYADRAVTFDGASQAKPPAHWIGRTLLTGDEKEAVGILRMLDCGSNTAFDRLDAVLKDTSRSIWLLHRIVIASKEEASKILTDVNLTPEQADSVLAMTHCNAPENYFITSEDMVGKSSVWAHFGSWDFARAEMWQDLRSLSREDAIHILAEGDNISADEVGTWYDEVQLINSEADANQWIAPWPAYAGNSVAPCSEKGGIIRCGNGLTVNLTSLEASIQTQQGLGVPQSLVFLANNGSFTEHVYNNSNMGVSAAVFPAPFGGTGSVFMVPVLAKSMFTRLYFFNGAGMQYFKPFAIERFISGGWVSVWNVSWTEQEPTGINKESTANEPSNTPSNTSPQNTASDKPVSSHAKVNYIGWLDDGTIFDSSIADWRSKAITNTSKFEDFETRLLEFDVGAGQMIPGFDAAVKDLKPGQETVVTLPPDLAYGTDPTRHRLGNKTLHFRIQRVE